MSQVVAVLLGNKDGDRGGEIERTGERSTGRGGQSIRVSASTAVWLRVNEVRVPAARGLETSVSREELSVMIEADTIGVAIVTVW